VNFIVSVVCEFEMSWEDVDKRGAEGPFISVQIVPPLFQRSSFHGSEMSIRVLIRTFVAQPRLSHFLVADGRDHEPRYCTNLIDKRLSTKFKQYFRMT
jgi:hypothetical protein